MRILLFVTLMILTIGKTCHSQSKTNSKDSIVFKGTTCYAFKRTKNPLVLVNEKKIGRRRLKRLNEKNVDYIKILKGDSAILAYGKRGQYGVVLIKTK